MLKNECKCALVYTLYPLDSDYSTKMLSVRSLAKTSIAAIYPSFFVKLFVELQTLSVWGEARGCTVFWLCFEVKVLSEL